MGRSASGVRKNAFRRYIPAFLFASVLSVAAAPWLPASAQSRIGAYQGAWVEQSQACDKIFVGGQKGPSFRKPVNIFASAFIISGNRIRTAQATCRINAVQPTGDRDLVKLVCTNAISSDAISVLLGRGPDGSLRRYFDEQDTVGNRYEHCAL